MTWADIWAIFGGNYSAEFKQWVEGQSGVDPGKINSDNIQQLAQVLNKLYSANAHLATEDTVGGADKGMAEDVEFSVDETTGQRWMRQKEWKPQADVWDAKTKTWIPQPDKFTWGDWSPESTSYQQWQMARTEAQDILGQQQSAAELAQRQQELIWNRSEAAMRNVFQPSPAESQMPSDEPVNWINYWKAGQDVAKRQLAGEQRQGAINWNAANMTPEQINQVSMGYAQPGMNTFAGNREGIDPTTGQRVQWTQPGQIGQMWDPFTQSYRPETNQEYQYRLAQQGVNAGIFTPEQTQQAQWSQFYDQSEGDPAQKQAWMEQQAALWRQPNFPTGPETPQWATSVLQKPQARINLGTLGQQGNMVRPVSAQMYSGWAPSQQQGYQGLVEAQKGAYWPDYQANIERMWGASRPGQLARQRVPSWS